MPCKLIVGSYNLRTPGSKDPFPNDWESRMPRINADIARMGYHIFGAQETIDFYTPHICRGNAFVSIGHGRCENADGEACNIYYDKDKLECLSHETFWLSPTPERCSVVKGATYPRICTVGVFEEKTSRTKFIFANTHLEHKVKELQTQQLQHLFEKLNSAYEKLPLILTGDFNAYPDAPAVQYALTQLRDARALSAVPATFSGATYHGYISDPAQRRQTDRIDYIFVSEHVSVERFEVIDNFTDTDTASSDHFPLRAGISF
jgi:endonuclease/exonuclease/phosphatase family metal-dependent hydrolase